MATGGNCPDHAAHVPDALHFLQDLFFHFLGQGFDEVGAGQGVDRIAQPDFVHEDLQRPQGEQGGPRGWDGIGFVKGAQGRGLGAAQGRRQGIIGARG